MLTKPVRDEEANALFSGLEDLRGLVFAVSGGSDFTALLVLAARWDVDLRSGGNIRRTLRQSLSITGFAGVRSAKRWP